MIKEEFYINKNIIELTKEVEITRYIKEHQLNEAIFMTQLIYSMIYVTNSCMNIISLHAINDVIFPKAL